MTSDNDKPQDQETADQNVWISFRCTSTERAELRDHAHIARLSISELARRRVLGQPRPSAAVPQLNVQFHADLGRVGNKLDWLIKLATEPGKDQIQSLVEVLGELKGQLRRVQLEVIGAYRNDKQDQE